MVFLTRNPPPWAAPTCTSSQCIDLGPPSSWTLMAFTISAVEVAARGGQVRVEGEAAVGGREKEEEEEESGRV